MRRQRNIARSTGLLAQRCTLSLELFLLLLWGVLVPGASAQLFGD
jgi:hypothetical protein